MSPTTTRFPDRATALPNPLDPDAGRARVATRAPVSVSYTPTAPPENDPTAIRFPETATAAPYCAPNTGPVGPVTAASGAGFGGPATVTVTVPTAVPPFPSDAV